MHAERFAGRTAIITGGASGLGRATAQRIVAEGGRVAPGLAARLERDLLIALFNEFFAPHPASRPF